MCSKLGPGWNLPFARLQPGRVAPKRLQVITVPHILPHDVDNNIEIIENYPSGLKRAVHRNWLQSMVFPDFVLDFIHNRAEMRLAVPEAMTK